MLIVSIVSGCVTLFQVHPAIQVNRLRFAVTRDNHVVGVMPRNVTISRGGGVGQDHVQQLLLTLHYGVLKHVVATNACVFQVETGARKRLWGSSRP